MTRDEILAKSKDENKRNPDKYKMEVIKKANLIAFSVSFYAIFAIHWIRESKEFPSSYDLMLLYFFPYFIFVLYCSVKTKRISYIIFTLLFFIGSVGSLYKYWLILNTH